MLHCRNLQLVREAGRGPTGDLRVVRLSQRQGGCVCQSYGVPARGEVVDRRDSRVATAIAEEQATSDEIGRV